MDETKADIAVYGLAVMGQNLILNMNDHGFKVAAFNRTVSKVDDFLNGPAKGTEVIGAHSLEEMVSSLKKPRKILMMVKAGEAVDETIEHLLQLIEPGDILIDGGNTLYSDTERRMNYLKDKGILYIGMGVSGGEEGARHGPALMPGGSPEAWEHVKDIFMSIAAKGAGDLPCCDWLGTGGAGHYVKMVHNGIEYGDMQLIAESYQVLKDLVHLSNEDMANTFESWNSQQLESYLIQITADILRYKDQDGSYLIDKILDSAGQKGTGKWTVISGSEFGQPISVIAEALFARFTSSLKDERVSLASKYQKSRDNPEVDHEEYVEAVKNALYASKIISYSQGFMLMSAANKKFNWRLNFSSIAQIWTGGCIIRSRFLSNIKEAYASNPELDSLLTSDFFVSAINASLPDWRKLVSTCASQGIPTPGLSSALSFFDSITSDKLPANLIQAQRDYFGAHTYELLDSPMGEFHHTNWTGHGGSTSASSYSV
ncbi:MAG TPA: decarboxylating NADP(+)-dependent phosphogluconate dehydrogenase [Candidatus Sulfotelmatobacter sp.]|nr:decarboxylating NADP(+)-dependent phosphogluconate dehydrogenase [Candidatus Sulfotelmatobacter sp.]